MMKKFAMTFSYIFTTVSIFSFLIGRITLRFEQFELARPSAIFMGTMLIAILIAISIKIYESRKGNGILNVVVAYIITAPVPFILQFMYQNLLFRFIRGIYILLGIYVLFYTLFILFQHIKNRQSQKELNDLLPKKDTSKQ
jgi:hypothetical protein